MQSIKRQPLVADEAPGVAATPVGAQVPAVPAPAQVPAQVPAEVPPHERAQIPPQAPAEQAPAEQGAAQQEPAAAAAAAPRLFNCQHSGVELFSWLEYARDTPICPQNIKPNFS